MWRRARERSKDEAWAFRSGWGRQVGRMKAFRVLRFRFHFFRKVQYGRLGIAWSSSYQNPRRIGPLVARPKLQWRRLRSESRRRCPTCFSTKECPGLGGGGTTSGSGGLLSENLESRPSLLQSAQEMQLGDDLLYAAGLVMGPVTSA